jgi:hypothetical protein
MARLLYPNGGANATDFFGAGSDDPAGCREKKAVLEI